MSGICPVAEFSIFRWQYFQMGAALALACPISHILYQRYFGHFSVGGPFAAGDGQQAGDTIAFFVVEQHKGARDIAGLIGFGFLVKRAHARPGAQHTQLAETGDDLFALREHELHFPGFDGEIVGVRNLLISGAHHRHRVSGDEDIPIGGHFQSVDYGIDDAVADGDHGAFARADGDFNTGSCTNFAHPGARSIDDQVGVDFDGFVANQIVAKYSDDTVRRDDGLRSITG